MQTGEVCATVSERRTINVKWHKKHSWVTAGTTLTYYKTEAAPEGTLLQSILQTSARPQHTAPHCSQPSVQIPQQNLQGPVGPRLCDLSRLMALLSGPTHPLALCLSPAGFSNAVSSACSIPPSSLPSTACNNHSSFMSPCKWVSAYQGCSGLPSWGYRVFICAPKLRWVGTVWSALTAWGNFRLDIMDASDSLRVIR